MIPLDLESSHNFWKEYSDPMIYRVVAFMETVEDWTLDGDPELEKSIQNLGKCLANIAKFELSNEELFLILLAHIKTSRILRILQAIDTIDPGSASKILMYAEGHNSPQNLIAGLLLRRNITFERLRLLARVFSAERFKLVNSALEDA